MAHGAGVSFELERLDLEGDELVVSGHWSGVRGLRFVRPTLVAADRRILATLEHKPWAPAVDRTWTAAFPWDRDEIDVEGLVLSVSPQVTVALSNGRAAEPEPEPQPARAPELPGPREDLPAVTAAAPIDAARLASLEAELDEVARARAAAERDRDRALAQLAEAVAAREAAVRTRTRMQLAHEEALQAREAAAAAVSAAEAQRDEANAQRDEVLLAYRALQRRIQAELAQEDRAGKPAAGEEDGCEQPIGVRKMPAARTVMAELQRRPGAGKLPFSVFDLWVVRILGTVAAACFILLLVSILRVFV